MPQSHQQGLLRGVTNPIAEKVCSKCGILKTAESFPSQASRTTGLGSWCRDCVSIRHRARRYGLTFDEAKVILADWDGRCSICLETLTCRPRFDHNHTTGKFRGILCNRCNTNIAILDDEAWLKKAMEYLRD